MAVAKFSSNREANRFYLLILLTLITIGIGSIFYHTVERLAWIDAIYFCVVTLTTVGYGDITPHTIPGKIFTIFYILSGIGIIAAFANEFFKRRETRYKKRQEEKRHRR